jgi:hypothetical protein
VLTSIGVVAVIRGASSCYSGYALAEIQKATAAGCADFWLNRYQSLIIGLISTAVAAGAAILVLQQLGAMAHQNTLAHAALGIAKKQRQAEERQQISAAIETTQRLYGLMSVVPLALGDVMKVADEFTVRKEFTKHIKNISPVMQEFRREVPHLLSTHDEKAYYREFDDHNNSVGMYFFVGAAHDYGMDTKGAYANMKYMPKDKFGVIENLVYANIALWNLRAKLQERLDS